MINRFDTIRERGRRTDGHRMTAQAALAAWLGCCRAAKNKLEVVLVAKGIEYM